MYMKNEASCGRRRHHHRENCACLISSLVVVAVVFRVGVGTGGGVGWGRGRAIRGVEDAVSIPRVKEDSLRSSYGKARLMPLRKS